ncbi:MAG: PKD domain-containing protein [Chloroflexi bacterium]|nr:PKD domain-containing protein [Chloroflexota bacterium]
MCSKRILVAIVALIGALGFAAASPPAGGSVAQAQVGQILVFAGGPYSGQVGQQIFFSAQASIGGLQTGGVVQFQWNFGDGGTAFGQTATHAYAAAGVYTVSVFVQAPNGQSGFATTSANIGGFGQGALQVTAGGPYSGQVGAQIFMTAQAVFGVQSVIANYIWNFGDGTSGAGQSTTHVYAAAGTYTVTVTVTITTGQTGSAVTTATVGGSTTTTTTPGGTEQVQLFAACNNVAVTWPNGTPLVTVTGAISPSGSISAIWFFINAQQRFVGFSLLPGAPNDLTMVNRGDPVFICMNTTGTLTRPII